MANLDDSAFHHTRSTSVPSIATTPASPRELECGSFEWSGPNATEKCSPWFATAGRRRAGLERERPGLKVLVQPHTTPLPSTPTFSSFTDGGALLPPAVILTPASPPPTPDRLPQSISSPSLSSLLSVFSCSNKQPKRSSSSTSLADQQKAAAQQYFLSSPSTPKSPRQRDQSPKRKEKHAKLRQSLDATGMGMELLPLHHVGGVTVGVARGRGERAVERLGRVVGVMLLLMAGVVVLRVVGDVWVARAMRGRGGRE